MSYQQCPICFGTGNNPQPPNLEKCKVCNGALIISTLTGLPPKQVDSTCVQSQPHNQGIRN